LTGDVARGLAGSSFDDLSPCCESTPDIYGLAIKPDEQAIWLPNFTDHEFYQFDGINSSNFLFVHPSL
jgi:hypothetical protein